MPRPSLNGMRRRRRCESIEKTTWACALPRSEWSCCMLFIEPIPSPSMELRQAGSGLPPFTTELRQGVIRGCSRETPRPGGLIRGPRMAMQRPQVFSRNELPLPEAAHAVAPRTRKTTQGSANAPVSWIASGECLAPARATLSGCNGRGVAQLGQPGSPGAHSSPAFWRRAGGTHRSGRVRFARRRSRASRSRSARSGPARSTPRPVCPHVGTDRRAIPRKSAGVSSMCSPDSSTTSRSTTATSLTHSPCARRILSTSTPRAAPRPTAIPRPTCRSSHSPGTDGFAGQFLGDALPTLPRWTVPGFQWGPAVWARPDGTYVLYYSTPATIPLGCLGSSPAAGCVRTAQGQTSAACISRATATNPAGPFIDNSSSAFVCPIDRAGPSTPACSSRPTGRPTCCGRATATAATNRPSSTPSNWPPTAFRRWGRPIR